VASWVDFFRFGRKECDVMGGQSRRYRRIP
jgi:hypothetical protein